MTPEEQVKAMYRALWQGRGPQNWWPADSAFEVVVGAFLTQNTAWTNVERAMANLRAADALSIEAVRRLPLAELEQLIRPAGYFRQKAQRLKNFVRFLDEEFSGSLDRLFATATAELRLRLLSLNGVGPETADSILLYGGNHESFVVDAYTRRVFARHGVLAASAGYEEARALVESALHEAITPIAAGEGGAAHPPSTASQMARSVRAQRFNEMHALLVHVGKEYCAKTTPRCESCPLRELLPTGGVLPDLPAKKRTAFRRPAAPREIAR